MAATIERSSNIREEILQRSILSIVPGLVLIVLGAVMASYPGLWTPLGWVLLAIGVAAGGYGAAQLVQLRKVRSFPVLCPFCSHKNEFVAAVESDVRCEECNRMVPIQNGQVMEVFQVRCGFCNALNHYTSKSTGLLCEDCNRVIPIAVEEGRQASAAFSAYATVDDEQTYELVLTGGGAKSEDLVSCLQHMLALNRNQVKQILEEAPVVLLTGIPKKKAELLRAQICLHHGEAEFKPVGR